MKKKRIWLWIGAVISGFLFGMVSVALKGVLITISMESVLYTTYYLLLFVGAVSLAITLYYLRKSRECYATYQTVEDDEENEQVYIKMYRYLDYGTIASNILMISVLFCLVMIVSPYLKISI